MTWWGWVLLAVYIAGWLFSVPRIAYVMANDLSSNPYGADIAISLVLGSLIALGWPVIFPIYRWYRFAQERKISGAGLLIAPSHIRRQVELDTREREMAEREYRIRQMERELDIGPER